MTGINFSGSPPILLPRRAAVRWRGIFNRSGQPNELNMEEPKTDYDKACAASRAGNGLLKVGGDECLVLYTESDWHIWVDSLSIIVCGNWVPPDDVLDRALWLDPLTWHCSERHPILLNSSVDTSMKLSEGDDFVRTSLLEGKYRVERASVSDDINESIVHRFTKN
jgi:hypothetical protein